MQLWIIFRSSVAWLASFAVMGFGVCASIALRLFGVSYPTVHRLVAAPSMAFCCKIVGMRVEVVRDPSFDPSRPYVFAQNHTSLLDAHVACAAIPQPFCGLMNAWQFHIPIYGWMMRVSQGIPVRRGSTSKIVADITREARVRRERGMSILVFPEAHRTRDGRVQPFRRGVFRMARDAGFPIVPIAVNGLFRVNRRRSYVFHPGRVRIWVGRPYETAGRSDEELRELAAELERKISRFVDEGVWDDAPATTQDSAPATDVR